MKERSERLARAKDCNRVIRMIAALGPRVFRYGLRDSEFTIAASGRVYFYDARSGYNVHADHHNALRDRVPVHHQRHLIRSLFTYVIDGRRIGRYHFDTPRDLTHWGCWPGYHDHMPDILALADTLGIVEPPTADTRPIHQATGA